MVKMETEKKISPLTWRLQKERERDEEATIAKNPKQKPDIKTVRHRAYRTLVRMATSMNRCISKSQAEMSYQLLYQSECLLTHETYTLFMKFPIWAAWQEREKQMKDETEREQLRKKENQEDEDLPLHAVIATAAAATGHPEDNSAAGAGVVGKEIPIPSSR